MAIYKLIQNTVFEPKDIERLVTAYEQTLRALRLMDRSDPITQLVAEKIIAIGRLEIEDPAEISKLALKELTTDRHLRERLLDPLDRRVLRVLHLDPVRRPRSLRNLSPVLVANCRTHAGIVRVVRYAFRMP